MRRKSVMLAVISVLVSVAIVVALVSYLQVRLESKAIEVSKGTPEVQYYLVAYPKAECKVSKIYVKSDGTVCTVDELWQPVRNIGSVSKPSDGKDHFCWSVHWYNRELGIHIPHIVNVYVDRDSWQIALVEEAF